MAISADVLDAPGRPVTPAELIREMVPDQPVLLVGPAATWDAFGVTAWLEARGWSWTHAADAERARWLASIQKVSLILVAGDERGVWAIVEAIRPVTMAPVVVLARPSPAGVVSLVGVGVDAVVDPTCGADEVFARDRRARCAGPTTAGYRGSAIWPPMDCGSTSWRRSATSTADACTSRRPSTRSSRSS